MSLTDEQKKALALARARRRRAEAGQTTIAEGTNQFGSGLNEGIANFAGMPVDLMTGAMNLGIKGANSVFGSDIQPITDPVGGSGTFKSVLDPVITDQAPQTATQRYLRRGGQEVGFGVPAALTGASIPGYGMAAREALAPYLGTSVAGDVGAAVAGQTAREIAPDSAMADFWASLLGGGLASATAGAMTPPTVQPQSIDALRKTASDRWEAVKANPAQLTDSATAGLGAAVKDALPTSQLAPEAYPNAFRMADTVGTLKNPRVYDAEEARRIIGDSVAADPKEARVGVNMKRAIENYLAGLTPNDVTGGSVDSVISDLQSARKATHQASKYDTILNKEMRGESRAASTGTNGNQVNAIRQNIRTVLDKERDPTLRGQRQGFTPDEMAAMENIVLGSPGQNAARMLGRMSPTSGALPMMATGWGGGAGLGGAAMTGNPLMLLPAAAGGVGALGKALSERMTQSAVDDLMSIILNGGKKPAKSAARSAAVRAGIEQLIATPAQ